MIVKVYFGDDLEMSLVAEFQYEKIFADCKSALKEEARMSNKKMIVEVFKVEVIGDE